MDQSTQMILGLFLGIAVLIFLSMKTKIHTFIALIIAALITGLVGGASVTTTLESITTGFGKTLSNSGIIIGLGVMMGIVLEKSGAAQRIAMTFIKLFGKNKEEWALGVTGYLVSIPVFSDSGLIILTPIAKALSRLTGKSVAALGLALATGLQLTHVFVPPTPGPLTVAGIFDIDVGAMILTGVITTIPPFIVSMLYCKWLNKKLYFTESEDGLSIEKGEYRSDLIRSIDDVSTIYNESELPSSFLSFAPIIVPIILIFLNSLANFLEWEGAAIPFINLIGSPIVALIIGTLLSIYGLGKGMDRKEVLNHMEDSTKAVGMIMLITGAGGSLGAVVRDSGVGDALGQAVLNTHTPALLIPFVIAALMRIALGSATVALTTAATLTAPLVVTLGMNPLLGAMATCAGGVSFSYFNDSGFWVFNGLYGLKDIKDQFWAKTMISFIGSGTALLTVFIMSFFL